MKQRIKRPLITEKTLTRASAGWYTFVVDPAARKHEITADIETLYHVTVVDIRTAVMHGKMRRVGRRAQMTQKSDWKKAVVRLGEGQHIDAFEVTQEEQAKSA